MHNLNEKPNVLCLVGDDIINILNELKEYLKFNLLLYNDLSKDEPSLSYSAIIIDQKLINNKLILKYLNKKKKISKLLISNSENIHNLSFNDHIFIPFNLMELNKKIINLVSRKEFNSNSAIRINNFILDKNEKKFKKGEDFIVVTEKEIQLIELLFLENKPISKKYILKNIWNYADGADTHTVETHIYRLRKKILDKFQENNLILNDKQGYTI